MKKQKQKLVRIASSKKQKQVHSSQNFFQDRRKSLSLKQIQQNYATIPSNPQNKLQHSKSGIIQKLSSHLKHKIQMDLYAKDAIRQFDSQKIRRLQQIETQIEIINQQNALKLKQLDRMQKTLFKKIQSQMKRDKEIQQKWLSQYQKLNKQDYQIKLTKQVKKLKEREDWILIEKQQKRLQLMARVFEKRQLVIGRDKSHIPKVKNNIIQKVQQDQHKKNKSLKKQKKQQKNAQQLKQMGRQFLEHAKKVQAQKLKSNTKLLDVYKKNIDYLPEIKTILKNNGQDLSKPIQHGYINPRPKRKRYSPSKNSN